MDEAAARAGDHRYYGYGRFRLLMYAEELLKVGIDCLPSGDVDTDKAVLGRGGAADGKQLIATARVALDRMNFVDTTAGYEDGNPPNAYLTDAGRVVQ